MVPIRVTSKAQTLAVRVSVSPKILLQVDAAPITVALIGGNSSLDETVDRSLCDACSDDVCVCVSVLSCMHFVRSWLEDEINGQRASTSQALGGRSVYVGPLCIILVFFSYKINTEGTFYRTSRPSVCCE